MNPLLILTVGLLIGFPSAWKFIPLVVFFEWALFHFYPTEIYFKLLNLIQKLEAELDEIEEEKRSKKREKTQ
ncbi:hypothetical protein F7R25_04130 [Burkholderia stagnalis]|uniref:Uncharacterized protein n=1 Tax=Burkholderia stagnalis TaxID=1503054 RepID=A0A6L3N328_9BURK|nr:hypothetical protein [Burkholderia stagnalis]KAB0640693.1 hypothetical protein F7R25_04130 [Burkholderia stagnalis]VWB06646.1 hypothetical protein BST28156_00134 [Burkholderia stagnalis]